MSTRGTSYGLIILILAALWVYAQRSRPVASHEGPVASEMVSTPAATPQKTVAPRPAARRFPIPRNRVKKFEVVPLEIKDTKEVVAVPEPRRRTKSTNSVFRAHFDIEDGLAVTDGDIVLGQPLPGNDATSGYAIMPTLELWPSHVIPYYVQPNVVNPERVQKAMALFAGTAVQFVPFTDQNDVLVFEEGNGNCKSYVGKIGGKQPLWIPAGCDPAAIAHEMLHALGFVHEQNRADRDQFIKVRPDNIEEGHEENFAELPWSFMRVSGRTGFDFTSIMIYPDTMFSRNGEPTMVPVAKDQKIDHGNVLSALDIERVNRAYGDR